MFLQVCGACSAGQDEIASPRPALPLMVHAKSQTSRDVEVQTHSALTRQAASHTASKQLSGTGVQSSRQVPASTVPPADAPLERVENPVAAAAPLAEVRYTVEKPSGSAGSGKQRHLQDVPLEDDVPLEPQLLIPMLSNVEELYEAAAAAHPRQPLPPAIDLTT